MTHRVTVHIVSEDYASRIVTFKNGYLPVVFVGVEIS